MLWQAMAQLKAWPAGRCVAVDDAPVGIEAGRNAGLWTIGVVASGNGVGMDTNAWAALDSTAQAERLKPVIASFTKVGADFVIQSVADLALALDAIEQAVDAGRHPGSAATVALGCEAT
jgi:phosphonoacetaldehyde hydrolase